MNFVDKLFASGFNRKITAIESKKGRYDCKYNTNNGWMGLTVYHPYETFKKGGISVELSLERSGIKEIEIFHDGTQKEIQINERQIKVTINNEIVYYNKYGIMPSLEIEQKILN